MKITTDIEAFNHVKEQLLWQSQKSLNESDMCSYRGFTTGIKDETANEAALILAERRGCSIDEVYDIFGTEFSEIQNELILGLDYDLKCAVGHLISDDFYSLSLEENSVETNIVKEAVINSNPEWIINEKSLEMMQHLQFIHDSQQVDDWDKMLELFEFSPNGKFVSYDS
jgi:hypothetical protein